MEIQNMSAEELAKSFSNQNQNQQNQGQNQQQQQANPQEEAFNQFKVVDTQFSKSAEDIALEFSKTGKIDGKDVEKDTEDDENKGDEGKADQPQTTKLDDNFKQTLDRLFKEQKLNPYSDGTDDGYIVPETLEEVLELIDSNKNSWMEEAKAKDQQELVSQVLASKSPAWQFLLQQSETYTNPGDLVPLLTAVQNQEYTNSLDITDADDQEKIVRASLSIQGLPPESIEDEIVDLKERGKLDKRAEALKPVLDKYNEAQTTEVLRQKQVKDQESQKFWNTHYGKLEETVFKSQDLDGAKLDKEDRQLIASALIPDQELGGLPIYTVIDNLIANGDFTKLAKIILLAEKEESFDKYFLTGKASKKAEGVQRVLRQVGTSHTSVEENEGGGQRPKPIKKQYGFFG